MVKVTSAAAENSRGGTFSFRVEEIFGSFSVARTFFGAGSFLARRLGAAASGAIPPDFYSSKMAG